MFLIVKKKTEQKENNIWAHIIMWMNCFKIAIIDTKWSFKWEWTVHCWSHCTNRIYEFSSNEIILSKQYNSYVSLCDVCRSASHNCKLTVANYVPEPRSCYHQTIFLFFFLNVIRRIFWVCWYFFFLFIAMTLFVLNIDLIWWFFLVDFRLWTLSATKSNRNLVGMVCQNVVTFQLKVCQQKHFDCVWFLFDQTN